MSEYLDVDGYPTDEALDLIKNWSYEDKKGCFDFIKSLWYYPEYINEEKAEDEIFGHSVTRYNISTVGWSGNESIINSLSNNYIIWSSTWVQSRRGGHYIFEVKD